MENFKKPDEIKSGDAKILATCGENGSAENYTIAELLAMTQKEREKVGVGDGSWGSLYGHMKKHEKRHPSDTELEKAAKGIEDGIIEDMKKRDRKLGKSV